MKRLISYLLALTMTACANYRPLVDRPGPRYEQDLKECQAHAEGEPNPAAGAIIGAVLGALLGAVVGGGTGYQGDFMAAGAAGGAMGGAAGTGQNQVDIIKRCMAGRGYSVLR